MGANALLCNDCGYPLAALPDDGACPECGRSVASSRPEARRGSAWQRGMGIGSLVRTIVAFARRPRDAWERVRPERPLRSLAFASWSCLLGGVPLGLSVMVGGPETGAAHTMYAVMLACGYAGLTLALSLIESLGLALIGWRRRWAHSPAHLMAIIGHAAPGWIVGGLGTGLAWQVLQYLPWAWTSGRVIYSGREILPVGSWVGIVLGIGFGAGLLAFETLAYLGMKRLRYTRAA